MRVFIICFACRWPFMTQGMDSSGDTSVWRSRRVGRKMQMPLVIDDIQSEATKRFCKYLWDVRMCLQSLRAVRQDRSRKRQHFRSQLFVVKSVLWRQWRPKGKVHSPKIPVRVIILKTFRVSRFVCFLVCVRFLGSVSEISVCFI